MPDDFSTRHANRAPTPDEEAAAESGATEVDLDDVAEHFEKAAKLGANVRGEGEIVPRNLVSDDDKAGDEGIDEPPAQD